MKTHLSTVNQRPQIAFKGISVNDNKKIREALKELANLFNNIPEIGKFKPVSVHIYDPVRFSRVRKATISIGPSIKPDDYRTRVLTFSIKSPNDESILHEVSPASGNKFSIESTLKNPKLLRMFEDFVDSIDNI